MYVHMLYEYVYGKYNTYTLYISEKKRGTCTCLLLAAWTYVYNKIYDCIWYQYGVELLGPRYGGIAI